MSYSPIFCIYMLL